MGALVWHSTFASYTGYSGSSLAFTLGLDARGHAIRPLYLYGADLDELAIAGRMHPRILALQDAPVRLDVPQVVYAPGDRFAKNSGAYRIGYTMLEVDRLPLEWVQQANQMDELWTPTAWGADVFRASGIVRPVHVVPLGIDPQRSRSPVPRTRLRERTIFLSVFEWGARKGWDVLLKAYRAAFRPTDPVLLVLKIDCRAPVANPLRELARVLGAPAPPVTLLYNQPLTAVQLDELYAAADVFVLPSRGEGWGMPILEAMAAGTPAIATEWSGPTAFLTNENGYPLPYRTLVEADASHEHYRGARWAEPDVDALVELLRRVVADPDSRHARGRVARAAAQQWSWDRAIDVLEARFAAIARR